MQFTDPTKITNKIFGKRAQKLIKMGEMIFTRDPTKYHLLGLGPCLGIYIYNEKRKNYFMAHTTAPYQGEKTVEHPEKGLFRKNAKFTDMAIKVMVGRLKRRGNRRVDLKCKIVGGGKMFNDDSDLGWRNVLSARKTLKRERIELIGEDVGNRTSLAILNFFPDGKMRIRKKHQKYII